LKAFPNLGADEKARLQESRRMINEFSAKQILRELKMRSAAGQYKSVWQFLTRFPAEGIGGEVLQPVREMIQDYRVREARRGQVIEQLKALAGRLKDTIAKENLKPILDEIAAEIGPDTLPRMAAFLQVAEDRQTPDTEKLALAVSGWLMGADAATPKLPAAISAYKVRNLIREYLNGGSTPEREQAFGYIKEEAGGLEAVAQLLAHMKPAVPAGEPLADRPDRYQLQVQGPGSEPAVTYLIQLPPEYNPYRLYPTVVTLCGEGDTADKQIDWWADYAARQGYIILAPAWTVEHQRQYGYSAREHAAVLGPLRDACRRFAIDTDRVFLSGHSIGGDAAWDIGLSHPDLWAGVIPIAAQADRYCNLYWRNARYVPFYVVSGSLDGTRFVHNALDLDRYLHNGFNTTVIEYQGRGHENFREEILHVFDWMGYFHRNFFPHKFACQTMRPWDNFFWWVEVRGLPPKSEVDPTNWPPSAGTQAAPVTGEINDKNGISIHTGASQATVWLSPKMLDFNKRSIITVNGRRLNSPDQIIRPSLHVLLEDVRTRGDRLHPFWVKLEGATGRVKGE
jgi:pimeloyl-ACP methyl ester carboxylesterase